MAQSGYTPLSLYYSATAATAPLAANLVAGELALNTNDGKLYYKDSSGVVQVLASKTGNVNVSSFSGGTTGLTPSTATTGVVTLAGTLAQVNGGTGFSTYTTGDTVYASASNTLSKLAIGSTGQILRVVGGVPAWGTDYVGTVTSVSGTGTVNGLTLTGTVTSSGSLTLGGTLDLSSPPAIGATSASTGKFTSLTDTGLTSGRVTYATTGGLLTDSANMTFNGTTFSLANDASISGLTVGKGGGAVSGNTVVGYQALNANTSGSLNTVIGYQAGLANTSGANNFYGGYWTGLSGTTASYNVAIGVPDGGYGLSALQNNTTGQLNVAIGAGALGRNTTANRNVAVGYQPLFFNTTGAYNVGLGGYALNSNTTGSNSVAVGDGALNSNTTASYNAAVGYQAGYSNTTGTIAAFGPLALYSNTTGVYNVAVGTADPSGYAPLRSNTTGGSNTAMGSGALQSNTTASNNTAVGYQAGYTNTGGNNLFIGGRAGYSHATGNYSTYVGEEAGYFTTGAGNQFFGQGAGQVVTTGAKNTILGCYNGNLGGLDIRTASNYIVLSDGDGNPRGIFDNSGNFTVGGPFGAQNGISSATPSAGNQCFTGWNKDTTGNRFLAYFGTGATFSNCGSIYYNGTLTVYATTSDQRLKENIVNAGSGLEKLNNVKIRAFDWKESGNHTDFGVIAQELNQVAPEAVGEGIDKEDGSIDRPWSVDTAVLVPAMIKAIQELKAEVDSLKAQLGK